MTRLIQIQRDNTRRIALVDEPHVRLIDRATSVYDLAHRALIAGTSPAEFVAKHTSGETLNYDEIYAGRSEWRLLPPIDHPVEPARCLVSGTGLTHLGSAKDRQAMHEMAESALTDSMKMFRLGLEGGRPEPGQIGAPPEWFYKGTGTILRAHGAALEVPPYAEDGGEEAEIAGVYIVGPDGRPHRIGMTAGNEFSDHKFEKRNYLNLAASKIRTCSLGPEIVLDAAFERVPGKVSIERGSDLRWAKDIVTGEAEMCHSLANIEHHHFKYDTHRRAGDVHVHFYGAHSLSFGAGILLDDGDVMSVQFEGFGRALRNPLRRTASPAGIITVETFRVSRA
jgi:hypothetical protein